MSSRQVTFIAILAVLLGAVALVLFKRGASSWESATTPMREKVVTFPLNDVAHLVMKDATAEVNLIKKEDQWVVKERADYPANFEQVSRLLQKIWELKPVQSIKVGPTQFGRLNLIEPGGSANDNNSGTLLDLRDKNDKRITALLLGKEYLRKSEQPTRGRPDYAAGRYVMPEDGSKRVVLVSQSLEEVALKPERWLSRDFVAVEKPKSIALTTAAPEKNWKLVRDTESGPWKFGDATPGEEADSAKGSSIASNFAHMSFADVLDLNAKPEETGLDNPATVSFDTFDGFGYVFKVGKLNGNNYPVTVSVNANLAGQRVAPPDEKPEDKKKADEEFEKKKKILDEKLAKEKKAEGRTYLVTKFTVEQVMKNRSELVKAPATPLPLPGASPATAHSPGVAPLLRPPVSPRPHQPPRVSTPPKP